MIGVFVRANHPKGYGYGGGTAHGYIVVFVRGTRKQIDQVRQKLWVEPGLPEPLGHSTYRWYGGPMELIAILPGNKLEYAGVVYHGPGQRAKVSVGDNRFVGLYDADELL